MTTITSRSTLPDVCFAVCTALQRSGTVAVLTGGSAATLYAPERYQSQDADFVIMIARDPQVTVAALADLGFIERDGMYHHPDTRYTVEFPPGPLSIGLMVVSDYETIKRGAETLHVLSRTDVVCDRLAAFFHWDDRSSLRTALDVAESGEIDLTKVAQWSRKEGASEKFDEFQARYASAATMRSQGRDLDRSRSDLDL